MDDIPEEDMEKLDEKLVEAFKALGGKKSNAEKKREKLQHLAQQHFKLRALEPCLSVARFQVPIPPPAFAAIDSSAVPPCP